MGGRAWADRLLVPGCIPRGLSQGDRGNPLYKARLRWTYLRVLEFRVERKEQVERLDPTLVDRNV